MKVSMFPSCQNYQFTNPIHNIQTKIIFMFCFIGFEVVAVVASISISAQQTIEFEFEFEFNKMMTSEAPPTINILRV